MKHSKNGFANRLKEIRLIKGYSQKYVTKKLNFGETTLSGYELGRNEPSLHNLIQLAQFYDISVDYLCGLTNIPNSEKFLSKDYTRFLQTFRKLNSTMQPIILSYMKYLLYYKFH